MSNYRMTLHYNLTALFCNQLNVFSAVSSLTYRPQKLDYFKAISWSLSSEHQCIMKYFRLPSHLQDYNECIHLPT